MTKGDDIRTVGRELLFSGAAPAATGILIIILSINYLSAAPWETVGTTVGSVLIGAGVFDIVFRLVAFQYFVDRLSLTVLRALKLPLSAFYESRSSLDSVEHELTGVEEVWAAWHVGPYRDFETFFPKGRRGRILLTNPTSSSLLELSKIRKGDMETMASVIRNITRHALEKGLDVRWFDGPICNNVLMANPRRDNAWMRVELIVPHESPQKRPSFLAAKTGNAKLYETFNSAFEKTWQASSIPILELPIVEKEKVATRGL